MAIEKNAEVGMGKLECGMGKLECGSGKSECGRWNVECGLRPGGAIGAALRREVEVGSWGQLK